MRWVREKEEGNRERGRRETERGRERERLGLDKRGLKGERGGAGKKIYGTILHKSNAIRDFFSFWVWF